MEPNRGAPASILQGITEIIFDMDGVVTEMARIHALAWKHLLNESLKECAERYGRFQPWQT
jgi:beta-phosphoglucomutase-like phosphatase (HAD superfamily)